MTILDAYALIAFLGGERAAAEVEAILREEGSAILSISLAETIDVLVRVRGHDPAAVDAAIVPLIATRLGVLPVTEADARMGAAIRSKYYHRRTAPLSLADCLVLGGCVARQARVGTADAPMAWAAHREGIEVVSLPTKQETRPR